MPWTFGRTHGDLASLSFLFEDSFYSTLCQYMQNSLFNHFLGAGPFSLSWVTPKLLQRHECRPTSAACFLQLFHGRRARSSAALRRIATLGAALAGQLPHNVALFFEMAQPAPLANACNAAGDRLHLHDVFSKYDTYSCSLLHMQPVHVSQAWS